MDWDYGTIFKEPLESDGNTASSSGATGGCSDRLSAVALPDGQGTEIPPPPLPPPADGPARANEIDLGHAEDAQREDEEANGGESEEEYSREFRDLKEEATSLRHLMHHLPKNKYCRACQAGKLHPQRSGRKARGLGPVPTAFGEEVTADHIIARSARSQSVTGDHDALLIYDRATKWVDCYLVRT